MSYEKKSCTHVTFMYMPHTKGTHAGVYHVQIHMIQTMTLYCMYTRHTLQCSAHTHVPVKYIIHVILRNTGSTRSTCTYHTTYCTRRVLGGLVMRNLKYRDTIIVLDKFGELTGYS